MPAIPSARLLALAAALVAIPTGAPAQRYAVEAPIPGPDGSGWDYARVDPASRVLYVAHGDAVARIDLAKRGVATAVGSVRHAHAVLPIPGSPQLLVTSGTDSTVRLVDATSGAERARLSVAEDPDAAIYDPVSRHAFVMAAKAGDVVEVDPATAKVVRTIPVKPALEYAAIGAGRTLYVNDEDAGEIETVDLASGRIGRPIALPGCEGPSGLAYDPRHDRLIGACANGKAAVVDAGARRLIRLVDIGSGPDAVILDAARRLAFIPCGKDGVLEVLALDGPRGVHRIARVPTEVGARTGALDPVSGRIYLPTARFGPPTPGAKRPPALPGTFHIVVVAPRPARR